MPPIDFERALLFFSRQKQRTTNFSLPSFYLFSITRLSRRYIYEFNIQPPFYERSCYTRNKNKMSRKKYNSRAETVVVETIREEIRRGKEK